MLSLNVRSDSSCATPRLRNGRVAALTQKAIVVADQQNPSPGFTDAEYEAFGTQFDNLVWPVDTRNFGEPTDIDRNGRVIIFFTSAVNELTTRDDVFVGGFFFARDLFPKQRETGFEACPGSNVAEMFYMRVPDPNRDQRIFSKAAVTQGTVGTIAHEFQHLINAARRLRILRVSGQNWNEETWLNEGLSHIAEELVFYQASGLAPRQNIDAPRIRASTATVDAFNQYAISNFGRLSTYLQRPDTTSAIGVGDDLPTRGAAWAFLRYAADRKAGAEEQTWMSLVNSSNIGLNNVRAVFGVDPLEWLRDWTVSVYVDDAGIPNVEPRLLQPSWNFRDVFGALSNPPGRYPLQTLPVQNGTSTLSLRAGGAAFLRFGVAPATRAEIRVAQPGTASPATCVNAPALAVGGVFATDVPAGGTLCVAGGAAGSEYTLIPFFASEVRNQTTDLSVTGLGVISALGPPNPSVGPIGTLSFSLGGAALPVQDRGWERRLRERERRELTPLVSGGGASFQRQQSDAADAVVRLSLVRTR